MPPVDLTAPAPSYWKISPGEKGAYWPECHKGGYISMGFYELGDLGGISRQDFNSRRDDLLANDPGYADFSKMGLNMVWRFSQIQVGARIVANRGFFEVLGIGTVIKPYYYDEKADFPHKLGVRWDDTTRRTVSMRYWVPKLIELEHDTFLAILRSPPAEGQRAPTPPAAPATRTPTPGQSSRTATRRAPPLTFDRVVQALARGGYAFPDELVASYLLALQTRRFVILSGISGTGKTQLALQVGRILSASRLAAIAEDDPRPRITLTRDDLDRARIPLTPEILKQFPRFATALERRPEVMLSTHDDMLEQSVRVEGRPPVLVLQDTAAKWLTSTYRPGQRLALDIDDNATPPSVYVLPVSSGDATRTVEVVAVRPDWTDHRGLLGFYNPLIHRYQPTPFLRLVLAARDERDRAAKQGRRPRPFFAILDEMNLARVEHYFADLLSCLESGEPLHLHDDTRLASGDVLDAEAFPTHVELPPNLFLTGTVNVDETTHMFSPKVLDRAFVLEFNNVDLATYGDVTMAFMSPALNASPFRLTRAFPDPFDYTGNPSPDDWSRLRQQQPVELIRPVQAIHDVLRRDNRHFGFRVANELARFLNLAAAQTADTSEARLAALDIAVLAKVLPKLHGTQHELDDLLRALFAVCLTGASSMTDHAQADTWDLKAGTLGPKTKSPETRPPLLPRSATKLWRMIRRLHQQGHVSFIE